MANKILSSVYGKIEKILIVPEGIYHQANAEDYRGIRNAFAEPGQLIELRIERPNYRLNVSPPSTPSSGTTRSGGDPANTSDPRAQVRQLVQELRFTEQEETYRSIDVLSPNVDLGQVLRRWLTELEKLAPGTHQLTHEQWVQDSLVVLHNVDPERDVLLQSIYSKNLTDFLLPLYLSAHQDSGLDFYIKSTPIALQGGNILCGDKEAFIGVDLLEENAWIRVEHQLVVEAQSRMDKIQKKTNRNRPPQPRPRTPETTYRDGSGFRGPDPYLGFPEKKIHLNDFQKELKGYFFEKEVFKHCRKSAHGDLENNLGVDKIHYIGYDLPLPKFGVKEKSLSCQPLFHLDLFMTLTGQHTEEGKEIILIGCPIEARAIINHYGTMGSAGLLPENEKALNGLLALVHQQFRNSPELNPKYELVKIPLFCYDSKIYSWNNAVVEVYDDTNNIYLPTYREKDDAHFNQLVDKMEKRVLEVVEDCGLTPTFIGPGPFMSSMAGRKGSLNCLTKVLKRRPYIPPQPS